MPAISSTQFYVICFHLVYLDILIPVEFVKLVASESSIGKKAWVQEFLEGLRADDVDNPPAKLLKQSPAQCREDGTAEHQLFQTLLSSWIGHKLLKHLIRLGKRLMLNEDPLKAIALANPTETKLISTQINHIELLVPHQAGKMIQYAVELCESVGEGALEASSGVQAGLDDNDFSIGHLFFHWGVKYSQAQDVCVLPYGEVVRENIPKQLEVSSFDSEKMTPDYLYTTFTWRQGGGVRVSGVVPTMMLSENKQLRSALYFGSSIQGQMANDIMGCLSLASMAS